MRTKSRFLRRPALAAAAVVMIGSGVLATLSGPATASGILSTTTTVASSSSTISAGTPVTLTATVKTLGLGGLLITPSGSVTFAASNGTTTVNLGSSGITSACLVLIKSCNAAVTTSSLPAGSDTVTATFVGDTLSMSSAGAVSVLVTSPPSAPVLTSALPSSGSVELQWSAPSNNGGSPITGYTVLRSLTATGALTTVGSVSGTTTTFTDATAANGTTYFYEVSATNASGSSPESNQLSATPMAPIPGNPFQLVATPGNGSVSLAWMSSSTGATFNVYRSLVGGTKGTQIATAIVPKTYVDTTVTNGTTYFYEVTASNASGESGVSNQALATPSAPQAPGAPVLSPPSVNATTAAVTLTWAAPASQAPITSYKVYRSTTAGTQGSSIGTTSTLTFTDTTTAFGTTYFYEVTASSVNGEGAPSNQVTASIATPPPGAPTLTATPHVGAIQLTWTVPTSVAPVTSYNVFRGTSTGNESTNPMATGLPSPSYQDTTPVIGTTYFYEVVAISSGGQSAFSNEAHTAATSAGAGTSSVETCTANCANVTVTGSDNGTDTTNLTVVPESTNGQTITAALGATPFAGCTGSPGGGEIATVNSSNDPNGTEIKYILTGSEAVSAHNTYETPFDANFVGCLGLGTEWDHANGSLVPYNATDGLYEDSVVSCVNDGNDAIPGSSTTFNPGGQFTNPCQDVTDHLKDASPTQVFEIDFYLPPGDGKLGH